MVVTLILLASLVAACSPSQTGPGQADSLSLEGTQWVLVSLGGDPPLTGTAPSADFSAEQIGGSAGCNRYFGTYEASGTDISIGALGMTEMYCMDPEGVMDQEQAFLAALASATRYRVSDSRLELLDSAGSVILAFEPPPSLPDLPFEGTEWVLTTFIQGEAASSTLSGTEITLRFEGGEAAGSGGCNAYSGPYTLEQDVLTIVGVSITERGCLEPAGIMEQEAEYVDILLNVIALELDASQLTLTTADGRGLAFAAQQ